MRLRLSNELDKLELMKIWKQCFKDTDDSINYFFLKKFKPNKCTVCEVDSKVVASLYMLDVYISIEGSVEKAYYLYAAGTLPEYRGRGYMKSLISYANIIQFYRGKKYSILLPANDSLYDYYKILGYKKFFKSGFLELSNLQMKNYIRNIDILNENVDFEKVSLLRYKLCVNNSGSIVWEEQAIKYAFEINNIGKGENIVLSNGDYAICNLSSNSLNIIEFISTEKNFYNLMTKIYRKFPECDFYKFRFPQFCNYFNEKVVIKDFGMIKNIGDNSNFIDYMNNNNAYLGLTLD